jgi:HD superfamily phosphohydrolase YqeK
MKADVLMNEINLIKSEEIKKWTIDTLEKTPDYFFKAPASSTGKYHPTCTIKEGGLITHVKRAVYLANRLCVGWGIEYEKRDIVLSAVILHDIAKVGNPAVAKTSYEDYENHPLNAEQFFASIPQSEVMKKQYDIDADKPAYYEINQCIRNHMGLWTPASAKKDIKDYSLLELIVYTADYLSSTKDLVTPKDGE